MLTKTQEKILSRKQSYNYGGKEYIASPLYGGGEIRSARAWENKPCSGVHVASMSGQSRVTDYFLFFDNEG